MFPFSLAAQLSTDLHPVTNPVISPDGSIITTISGSRGQQVAQPLIRITPRGDKIPYNCEIMNPTGLAFSKDGQLYISSRNDGTVLRYTDFEQSGSYRRGSWRSMRNRFRFQRIFVCRRQIRKYLPDRLCRPKRRGCASRTQHFRLSSGHGCGGSSICDRTNFCHARLPLSYFHGWYGGTADGWFCQASGIGIPSRWRFADCRRVSGEKGDISIFTC